MKPAALNDGWTYRDRVPRPLPAPGERMAGGSLSPPMPRCGRSGSPPRADWNGALFSVIEPCRAETPLLAASTLAEEAIPDQWETIHDDGDLLVINKPSGLPVMPVGVRATRSRPARPLGPAGSSPRTLHLRPAGVCPHSAHPCPLGEAISARGWLPQGVSGLESAGAWLGFRAVFDGEQ